MSCLCALCVSVVNFSLSTEQAVIHERLANTRFAGTIQRAKWQAEVSGAAAQELHGRFDRNGVGSYSKHVPAQGKELAVLSLRFAHSSGVESADQRLQLTGHDVTD